MERRGWREYSCIGLTMTLSASHAYVIILFRGGDDGDDDDDDDNDDDDDDDDDDDEYNNPLGISCICDHPFQSKRVGMIMTLAKKSIRNFAPSSLKREKYRRRSYLQYFQRGAYLDEQNTPKNNDLIRHMAVYSKKNFFTLVCVFNLRIHMPPLSPTYNTHP